jgi:hypothetical protein
LRGSDGTEQSRKENRKKKPLHGHSPRWVERRSVPLGISSQPRPFTATDAKDAKELKKLLKLFFAHFAIFAVDRIG